MKDKNDIPQEVIDYCIDNRVSIEEGMTAVIDARLAAVEENLSSFKNEVTQTMNEANTKIEASEMKEVEDYLEFLNKNVQDNV